MPHAQDPARPQAVLVDMDGLLVDSEPLWTDAEQELCARLGGVFDEAVKAAVVGTRLDVAVPRIIQAMGRQPGPVLVAQSATFLLTRMTELLSEPQELLPGAADLLEALDAGGVPLALVSSSYRVLVDAVLGPLPNWFTITLAGDEVQRGKPDPEPYLTACSRLGVQPPGCVVLEDSPSGVASGLAAGCAVVAVPSVPGVHVPAGPRCLVRPTLEGLTVGDLSRLLG